MRSIGLLVRDDQIKQNVPKTPASKLTIEKTLRKEFHENNPAIAEDKFTLTDTIRFKNQPKIDGAGTVFLVAQDLVMTAAHCVVEPDGSYRNDLNQLIVVFDFCFVPDRAGSDSYAYQAKQENVYRVQEYVVRLSTLTMFQSTKLTYDV